MEGVPSPKPDDTLAPASSSKVSRRAVLRFTALAAAAAPTLSQVAFAPAAQAQPAAAGDNTDHPDLDSLVDVSIAQLQAAMKNHSATSREITRGYLRRIERLDPKMHSIIEVNPEA